jgi:hypothetical protein
MSKPVARLLQAVEPCEAATGVGGADAEGTTLEGDRFARLAAAPS